MAKLIAKSGIIISFHDTNCVMKGFYIFEFAYNFSHFVGIFRSFKSTETLRINLHFLDFNAKIWM